MAGGEAKAHRSFILGVPGRGKNFNSREEVCFKGGKTYEGGNGQK